jgi:hypothetical protein
MKIGKEIIDPFIIIGFLFTIIVTLLLLFLGIETITSTVFAMLGIIITLQIDQIARVEKNFQKNARYAELWQKLNSPSWLYPIINEIVDSVHTVIKGSEEEFELFSNSTKIELESCRNYLHDLGRGYLLTEYNNIEPIMHATEKSHFIIRAVSVSNVDDTFWKSSVGKRFWEANKKAIANGAKLERIFIYDTWRDKLKSTVEQQASIGANVSVYTVPRDQVPPNLRIDMTIIDENFMYEAVLNSDGVPIKNMFTINESDIIRTIKEFNMIKTLADKFTKGNET